MKKKIIRGLGVAFICVVAVLILDMVNDNINNSKPISQEARDKVVFEGFKEPVGAPECYGEVTEVVKQVDESTNPKLVIEVKNEYEELEKRDDFATLEEAKAWKQENWRRFKEYHQQNNGDIVAELGLDSMNITYEYSGVAPVIYAEFKGKITSKDMQRIYEIASHSRVTKVRVQTAEE